MNSILPIRPRGRLSAKKEAAHQAALDHFCELILEIRSTLDFKISARGWCYILEEHGLTKGEFNKAQSLIADCRKKGLLPLDIVAEDSAREFTGLEFIDDTGPEEEAQDIVDRISDAHLYYMPISFWADKSNYIQAMVEKIDLKSLFGPIFEEFYIPYANARGWSDLNSRASLMRRFKEAEDDGKRCVLLYCGDHDPGGLAISGFLKPNLADLAKAVGWSPERLHIDRFGLNYDFIQEHKLSWIDNLETSSGKRLDDPRHPDHIKPYVYEYIARYGARKVEANALVVRPEAGRTLCRNAILKYLNDDDPARYRASLAPAREEVRQEVIRLVGELSA